MHFQLKNTTLNTSWEGLYQFILLLVVYNRFYCLLLQNLLDSSDRLSNVWPSGGETHKPLYNSFHLDFLDNKKGEAHFHRWKLALWCHFTLRWSHCSCKWMCEISPDKWSLVEKQWPWYHKACILIPVLSRILYVVTYAPNSFLIKDMLS